MEEMEKRILTLEFQVKQLEELLSRVAKLEKTVWMAFGALAALELILKFSH